MLTVELKGWDAPVVALGHGVVNLVIISSTGNLQLVLILNLPNCQIRIVTV